MKLLANIHTYRLTAIKYNFVPSPVILIETVRPVYLVLFFLACPKKRKRRLDKTAITTPTITTATSVTCARYNRFVLTLSLSLLRSLVAAALLDYIIDR